MEKCDLYASRKFQELLNLRAHSGFLNAPVGCLNIKMSSYQYSDYHYNDKTVWR